MMHMILKIICSGFIVFGNFLYLISMVFPLVSGEKAKFYSLPDIKTVVANLNTYKLGELK